jgi:uncharacterized YccA/Bax inhibitor family protein
MTLQGVVNRTGILLLLCIGAGAFAWTHPELRGPFLLIGLIGGLIACLVGTFKPTTSPITAPVYGVLEGLALGAISQVIELSYPGIVLNAILLTVGVLGLMLVLYTTRTIRVTDGLVKGVLAATAAVFLEARPRCRLNGATAGKTTRRIPAKTARRPHVSTILPENGHQ